MTECNAITIIIGRVAVLVAIPLSPQSNRVYLETVRPPGTARVNYTTCACIKKYTTSGLNAKEAVF